MLRLMIVDDEDIIRESLSKMMDWNSIGYELVAAAKNGMEAYDVICDEYPDVVITDLKMPVLDGIELIERALNLDKDIRFIILSGYGEFEYAKKAMKFGVKYYLLKPTDKNQILNALEEIRLEELEVQQLKEQRKKLELENMLFTIEKCFLMEALNCSNDLDSVILKYQKVLTVPTGPMQLCICTYLEEKHLNSFIRDYNKLCKNIGIVELFPLMYVKNTAIMILKIEELTNQSLFVNQLEQLKYKDQTVSLVTQVQAFRDFKELIEITLNKIQRYSRILLYHQGEEPQEIRNSNIAFWKIDELSQLIINTVQPEQVITILTDTFQTITELDNAITFSISLSLRLKPSKDNIPFINSSKFIEELNECQSVTEVVEITKKHILHLLYNDGKDENNIKISIESLKNYVKTHLDASHLSLKWLAESYLFISVGYLSKQFIKEEGERFSDYLNCQRMEKAKKLLLIYNNGNIKDVAKEVGFENNPRYFSQVFKRYTGMTPSEFVEQSN